MATHASILAWKIPWTEKPGGLQSIGSQSRTQLSTGRDRERERTWESSLALVEEMSRRFYCPDFTAAGKRDELEKRTIKQNL